MTMLNFLKPKPEKVPLPKLPYGFRKRLSYLANYAVVNNLSQVCSDVKKFRSFFPDAQNQVYITDNHNVCRSAMKDTIKLRIWRYLHQYEWTRQIIDGHFTIRPAWTSVLLVDEITDKKKQIYVDDTVILHCTIENYEKIIPYIFGPYTRLVLHGNITWNQVQRLVHPGVVQVRINARIYLHPSEYDDFVAFAMRHIERGSDYKFSFYSEAYYNKTLFTKLNHANRDYKIHIHKNNDDPNSFHLTHRSNYGGLYYTLLFYLISFVITFTLLDFIGRITGETAFLYQVKEPQADCNIFIDGFMKIVVLLYAMLSFLLFFIPYVWPIDIISDRIVENNAPDDCLAVEKQFISNCFYWVVSHLQKLR